METARRKTINKKIQFIEVIKHTNGMDGLDNFYTDQSFVDWYKTTQDEGHS